MSTPPSPVYVPRNKAYWNEDPERNSILPVASGEASADATVAAGVLVAPRRRKGKEPIDEMGTELEKKPIVINMAKARGAVRRRFLAVGVFLSVMAITSKNLVEAMCKVWKIRGHLDSSQLLDRRFVLEFSEEGDFNHVTKGGPWRFREDAVLVDALKEGDDPETVPFTTVPIWVQFKRIPFYLLSKQLARDLGSRVGSLICIDENSRGDICNKFIRARVHLPIDQALQRWIPIIDGITVDDDDEVIVSVHYERLPTFCVFCGLIGHRDKECNLTDNMKRKSYSPELRVDPILKEDPRRWFLPEFTGQTRQQHAAAISWRTPRPASLKEGPTRQLAIVARVTDEVGKLSVKDQPTPEVALSMIATDTQGCTNIPAAPTDTIAQVCTNTPPAPDTLTPRRDQVGSNMAPAHPEAQRSGPVLSAAEDRAATATHTQKSCATWKRVQRNESLAMTSNIKSLTTQGWSLGAPRERPEVDEDDIPKEPMTKRILMQVPSLETCLGKENLAKLRQDEDKDAPILRGQGSVDAEKSLTTEQIACGVVEEDKAKDEEVATSPGAAGTLTGAEERACQEQ
jgi:hypothetical protein